MNTRELNKLSVVHFNGSAQLTQFSLAFSSMEQYVKSFQRFHAGEDVRPVTPCIFSRIFEQTNLINGPQIQQEYARTEQIVRCTF